MMRRCSSCPFLGVLFIGGIIMVSYYGSMKDSSIYINLDVDRKMSSLMKLTMELSEKVPKSNFNKDSLNLKMIGTDAFNSFNAKQLSNPLSTKKILSHQDKAFSTIRILKNPNPTTTTGIKITTISSISPPKSNELKESNQSSSNVQNYFPDSDKRSSVNKFVLKPNICGEKNVTLLICINMKRNGFNQRSVIRETWGSYGELLNETVKLAFILGSPKAKENPKIQKQILDEADRYHDIVQGKFIDDYHNVTLKVLSLLHWVNDMCSFVDYIIKTDDDVYVNIPLLISLLRNTSQAHPGQNFMIGHSHKRVTVIKNPKSKWYAPPNEYNKTHYPTYLGGFSYAMTRPTAISIKEAAYSTSFFWLEDVYITGIISKLANITLYHDNRFSWKKPNISRGDFYQGRVISGSALSIKEIRQVHEKLTNTTKTI